MNTANMHVGPVGAVNDTGTPNGAFLETGPQFKPKDLETWEQDSNTVLGTDRGLQNGMQYPVGIHNADKGSSGTSSQGNAY